MSAAPATDQELGALLAPVVDRFIAQAKEAITTAADEMRNVLRVDYNPAADRRPEDLAAPRLQLRWSHDDSGRSNWVCNYEMVLPLRQGDCRNDEGANFAVIELGRTLVGGGGAPPWERAIVEQSMPYRDGAHARWDAEALGGLPIYVLGPDGAARKVEPIQHDGVPA